MPPPRKTSRGSSRASYHGSRGGKYQKSSTFLVDFPDAGNRNGFTLQDEARNTERHHTWDAGRKLRYTKVDFLSAGHLDTSERKHADATNAFHRAKLKSQSNAEARSSDALEDPSRSSLAVQKIKRTPSSVDVHSTTSLTIRSRSLPRQRRSPSPALSNSSDEVIVFSGRGPIKDCETSPMPRDPTIESKIGKIQEEINGQKDLLEASMQRKHTMVAENLVHSPEQIFTPSDGIDSRLSSFHPHQKARGSTTKSQDDALMDDYVANLGSDVAELVNSAFSSPPISDGLAEVGTLTSDSAFQVDVLDETDKDQPNLCDFDDLSTSDGVMGSVETILSKRERKSGPQYLIVWSDQDEARWVPIETLIRFGAFSRIQAFESEEQLAAEYLGSSQDNLASSDGLETDGPQGLSIKATWPKEDSNWLSDDQFATLLVEKDAAGMFSESFQLGERGKDEADDDEAKTLVSPRPRYAKRLSAGSAGSLKIWRASGGFPSAKLLADAYDSFDVMDFDRPSLRRKSKGKPAFDISDTELEASLQMAWENDRSKKKQRKQERERQRSAGLLGRNSSNGNSDLKQTYKEGMAIQNVVKEVKNFLTRSDTTLALPPMDKTDRKFIHELANAFNLNSKSSGQGERRFPILSKSHRTPSTLSEGVFEAVEAKISRRFLRRTDVGGKMPIKRPSRGGGNINNVAVSYRDGDVVGASAPELGIDNKGRAMLEKMGWSSGTALGALNNKGRLQPVLHVVKTTKAGLG